MTGTGARRRAVPGRGAAAATVLGILGLLGLPGAAAVADEARAVQHDVEGTVVYAVADPLPHGDQEHFHEGSTLQAYAQVDGVLLDLSHLQAPVTGAEAPPPDALPGGAPVVVTLEAEPGTDRDSAVAQASAEDAPAGADPGAEVVAVAPVPTADLAAPAALAGAHDLVVLPVVWTAGAVAPTAALQTAATGTEQYWERQSAGRVDIRTSVRPAQAVTRPATCDVDAIMARALATNPGVTPSATTHVAVHFPGRTDCPFAGRATITGGSIWLNGATQTYVLAHELGHNFGLGHANTLTCTSGATRVPLAADTSTCTAREYGDNADVMGQGRDLSSPGSISTGFAHHLGWATIADVTGPATAARDVALAPLASTSAQRALRVSSSAGPVFVDYRPAVGADALHEPGWAGLQSHLVLTDARYGYPTSYLLDQQPAQPAFTRPFLPVGNAWEVPGAQVRLTAVSTGASAVVSVGPTGAAAQTQRYVTRVYADLFGRQPDPRGLQNWTTKLTSGTPRIAVANSITYSDEYRSRLIAATYQRYLDRAPDAHGAATWLQAMRTGRTIQQMEVGFVASDEYYRRAGGTDAAWVSRLYQHVLGRTAAPAEIRSWTNALARGTSRSQVALGFLISSEHLTTVVDGYYVDLLGRHIDPTGRRSWVTRIQNGERVEAIIGGIIASDEYFRKA